MFLYFSPFCFPSIVLDTLETGFHSVPWLAWCSLCGSSWPQRSTYLCHPHTPSAGIRGVTIQLTSPCSTLGHFLSMTPIALDLAEIQFLQLLSYSSLVYGGKSACFWQYTHNLQWLHVWLGFISSPFPALVDILEGISWFFCGRRKLVATGLSGNSLLNTCLRQHLLTVSFTFCDMV